VHRLVQPLQKWLQIVRLHLEELPQLGSEGTADEKWDIVVTADPGALGQSQQQCNRGAFVKATVTYSLLVGPHQILDKREFAHVVEGANVSHNFAELDDGQRLPFPLQEYYTKSTE
jgi:hypothetical protein